MEIIERISDLLAERDKTAIELCKVLDIQTSTMSTWKTRKKDPPARYMPAIANFLCVSLDYLLTGKERPAVIEQPEVQEPKLSAMDEELLDLFHELPMSKQYEFMGELKGFLRAVEEEMAGHDAPAILFYLASFCASLNCCDTQTLYRTTAKIQRLQARISLPDESLIAMVHSYGPLSDEACQLSLLQSLSGELPAVLT